VEGMLHGGVASGGGLEGREGGKGKGHGVNSVDD